VIYGKNQNLALFHLKKGAHVSSHQHVSEQVTQVLKGTLRLIIAGEEVVLGVGDVVVIPSNAVHEAFADEDAEVQDSFSPKRDDWLKNEVDYMKK
jgi:quercetin dioxygenase-like cupin family protein